jgi:hypothetical protein
VGFGQNEQEPFKGLLNKVFAPLGKIGFERTRRALSAFVLCLFVCFYGLLALLMGMNGQEMWVPAFLGMAALYGAAFMAVAAEVFWGRWFASGLAWSGVMVAVASTVMIGWTPVLGIYGALHALVVVLLGGEKMAARYDLQPAWRERYAMDDFGVDRLRKTVTRASASLPSVVIWALGPKEPGHALFALGTLAAGLLAVGGLAGVVRARTWGLLALGGAAAALAVGTASVYPHFDFSSLATSTGASGLAFEPWAYRELVIGPALPILLLGAAVAPFAVQAARFLKKPA